jgi:chorismate mutase
MENIDQLRKRIDEVDEQILHALSKRIELCRLIGLLKKKQRIPIKDTPRENDVHTHIKKKASALGLDPAYAETIYRQIVNMCTAIQESEEKGE